MTCQLVWISKITHSSCNLHTHSMQSDVDQQNHSQCDLMKITQHDLVSISKITHNVN